MPTGDRSRKATDEQVTSALWRYNGNVTRAAEWLTISRPTLLERRKRLLERGVALPGVPWNHAAGETRPDPEPLSAGRVEPREALSRDLPPPGQVATYLMTAATNNTDIHPALWRNILALQAHYEAHGSCEILIRRIGYNLAEWRRRGASNELAVDEDGDPIRFDPALGPYICDERVQLAPGICWAGDAPV